MTIVWAVAAAAFAQGAQDPAERLKTERVTLDLRGADLADAVRVVGDVIGVPIYVAPGTLDELLESERMVSVRARDITARSLLRLILKPRALTLTVREGVVMVVKESDLESAVVTRVYDVQDLTARVEDFPLPTPDFGILPGYGGRGSSSRGGGGAALTSQLLNELWAPEGGGEEMDVMRLSELIQTHAGGESWTTDPKVGIQEIRGILIVAQTEPVHGEIEELLGALRRMR